LAVASAGSSCEGTDSVDEAPVHAKSSVLRAATAKVARRR
jgi:hypothetical protein